MTLCCYGLLENSLRQGHQHGSFGGSPPAKAPAGRKRPNGKLCQPTEPAKERLYVEISCDSRLVRCLAVSCSPTQRRQEALCVATPSPPKPLPSEFRTPPSKERPCVSQEPRDSRWREAEGISLWQRETDKSCKIRRSGRVCFSPRLPLCPPSPPPACLRVSHLWNLVQVLRQFGCLRHIQHR